MIINPVCVSLLEPKLARRCVPSDRSNANRNIMTTLCLCLCVHIPPSSSEKEGTGSVICTYVVSVKNRKLPRIKLRQYSQHQFDSQVSQVNRSQDLEEKRNIQEFRPGRSAMQWHCGLRL